MSELQTFRDTEASLWQSAVTDALARHPVEGMPPAFALALPLPRPDHPVIRAAALAGAVIAHLNSRSPAVSFAPQPLAAVVSPDDPVQFGPTVVELARRFPADEPRFQEALRLKFGHLDPLWAEAAINYYRYLQAHRADVPYRVHENWTDFDITDKLPAQATVALVADWGTGTAEAYAVLQQIAAQQPDVLIHLGDIYYSGQQSEVESRFLSLCRRAFDGRSIPIFTLAGNHDMYSGGQPYYWLLDQLGQPASYFCLRNADWQILALDTGRNSDLRDTAPTFLQDTEVDWVNQHIDQAGNRKTILLSHHQLFSAYESIGGGGVNPRLLEQLGPILNKVVWWFWGHEHDLVLYGESQGLERGRCIGHGAIPVTVRLGGALGQPRPKKYDLPVDATVQLSRTGFYYNHGYVILRLDGASATAAYYQQSDAEHPQYEESIE